MQFIQKFVFLLFLAIQNVCSMQNSIDPSAESHTMEIIANIRMMDLSLEEQDAMILEAMQAASLQSLSKEDVKRMEAAKETQRKSAAEERRFSNQCGEQVQIQVDDCFCGFRGGKGKNIEDEIEQWCSYGSYCYNAYTSKTLRDAACYDNRPCVKSSLEEAQENGELDGTCMCGYGPTECGPGKYCSEKGQCLSQTQSECPRNTKLITDVCMCEQKECQERSVCVQRSGYSRDQCMQFCDTNLSDMGDNEDCICSAPNKDPLEIKFCEDTQICTAVENKPECVDVEMGEEDTWDME